MRRAGERAGRGRRSGAVLAGIATGLLAVLVAGVAIAYLWNRSSGERWCASSAQCAAGLTDADTLVATSGAATDAAIRASADGGAALLGLDGRVRWRVRTGSELPPRVLAAGDVDGDGVTDYVLGVVHRGVSSQGCGSATADNSSLLMVDGRSGRASDPFPALADVCWRSATFTYPTRQWDAGTVYIGDLSPSHRGAEVVLTPTYAHEGTVWNLEHAGQWRRVRSPAARTLAFPSGPEFDRIYNATNPSPCERPLPGERCFVQNSHVANGVLLPGAAGPAFLVLTSGRAVVYRADLTPTSDTAWSSGSIPGNGGRNYGLVEAYGSGGETFVDLIGGCSVEFMSRAMAPGAAPTGGDDNCGVVRHVERFTVRAGRITAHAGTYYGYSGTHGALEGRVEYPARPRAPLGGPGTSWSAFNLLRGGSWAAHVLRGPTATQPLELPGWFVWDSVDLGDGHAGLLATRMAPGQLVAPFEMDVLSWNGQAFRSVQHVGGAVPRLVRLAPRPTLRSSESGLFGAFVRDVADDGRPEVLVTGADGRRRFVTLEGLPGGE